jgi:hypothetical protein
MERKKSRWYADVHIYSIYDANKRSISLMRTVEQLDNNPQSSGIKTTLLNVRIYTIFFLSTSAAIQTHA